MNWTTYLKAQSPADCDAESVIMAGTVPAEAADYLRTTVNNAIKSGHIIEAIKEVRSKFNLSLLPAKRLVDAIRKLGYVKQLVSDDLVTAIETTMDSCRIALRKSDGVEKADLAEIHAKLNTIWRKLVGVDG